MSLFRRALLACMMLIWLIGSIPAGARAAACRSTMLQAAHACCMPAQKSCDMECCKIHVPGQVSDSAVPTARTISNLPAAAIAWRLPQASASLIAAGADGIPACAASSERRGSPVKIYLLHRSLLI